MVDADRLRRRLALLDERLSALRRLHRQGRAPYLEDADRRALVERHLQVALQAAIDVALHIVAEKGGRTPEDYGEAFVVLAELEVLGTDLAIRLRSAAGLRNVLVHGYAEVDPLLVWAALAELGDLEALARSVDALLRAEDNADG